MIKYFVALALLAAIVPLVSANTQIYSNTQSIFSNGINTTQICINGDCQTSWPSGGGSGLSGLTAGGVLVATNSTNAQTLNVFNFGNSFQLIGQNSTSQTAYTQLEIFNKGQLNDGTGASGRTQINLWTGDKGNPNNLPLSINAHSNFTGGQPREVTFYSSLINNSYAGKAFHWRTGENSDGLLRIQDLYSLYFTEQNYRGFYQNQTALTPRIHVAAPNFSINLDVNGINSDETFTVTQNGFFSTNRIFQANQNISFLNSDYVGVGKGLVNPFYALHIRNANANNTLRLSDARDKNWLVGETSNVINFYSEDFSGNFPGTQFEIATIAEDTFGTSWGLQFSANGANTGNLTPAMRINSIGRVGINTTSPTQLLDVRGNVNISGVTYTPELCLNGDCRSSWPSVVNATCSVFTSPNGLTKLELCN